PGSPKNAIKETMPKIVDTLPAFPAASFLGRSARGDNGAPAGGAPASGGAAPSAPGVAPAGTVEARPMPQGATQAGQSGARPRSPGLTLPPPSR
ncbi:MAG: hypothetical protein ACK5FB_02430, partial [Burkholderiales bacterium]